MANGAESSFTVAGPSASRARMARRVGSERAAKVLLSCSASIGYRTAWLFNPKVILQATVARVKHFSARLREL